MICFYHSADLDGHCSGALIKLAYPECEMIGINYGDDFPWWKVKGQKVFMVDFSLQPFKGMIKLAMKSDLVWIDHHKSAIEDYEKEQLNEGLYIEGIQRSGIGACQLVWEYLKIEEEQGFYFPTFVKLLAEYDVWNHSDARTLPFQYGMRQQKDTLPENTGFWRTLFDYEEVMRITKIGGHILQYADSENEKYVKACGFETNLDGLECIAINKMLTNSKIFDSVWNPEKYDAMLTFGWRKSQWTVSLYTDKPNIDVSVIAKNRGGGGHKQAAGFQCKELPFALG